MTDFHDDLTDELHKHVTCAVCLLDDVDDFLADVLASLSAFEQNRAFELRRRIETWFTGTKSQ